MSREGSEAVKVLRLDRADLERWFANWAKTREVYAPLEQSSASQSISATTSYVDWAILKDGEFPELDTGLPKSPIKKFFFPQPETLLRSSKRKGDPDAFVLKEPEDDRPKRVLVGVRPCDARSVELNNFPFEKDPYFQANRARTTIVGFTCRDRCQTCFCKAVGGSPVGTEGMDIAVTQLDDLYIVEVITERGKELVQEGGGASEASEGELSRLKESKEQAESLFSSMPDPAQSLEAMKGKDLSALYNAPFWSQLADSCINCGICTFLCPTCYCFDIQDEVVKGSVRRIRYYDSCMFPLFTLQASGNNPRGQKVQRVRNRFMHKFKYFPDRFGPFSCVGCGRCIRECPVNIDIREVLKDLLAVE